MDGFGETIIKKFGSDASQALVTYVPSGILQFAERIGDLPCYPYMLMFVLSFSLFTLNSGAGWSIGDDSKFNMDSGLLTEKIVCLVESLLEYRSECMHDH